MAGRIVGLWRVVGVGGHLHGVRVAGKQRPKTWAARLFDGAVRLPYPALSAPSGELLASMDLLPAEAGLGCDNITPVEARENNGRTTSSPNASSAVVNH